MFGNTYTSSRTGSPRRTSRADHLRVSALLRASDGGPPRRRCPLPPAGRRRGCPAGRARGHGFLLSRGRGRGKGARPGVRSEKKSPTRVPGAQPARAAPMKARRGPLAPPSRSRLLAHEERGWGGGARTRRRRRGSGDCLNQWRKLMRLVKVEDLRKDIEILRRRRARGRASSATIIQVLDRGSRTRRAVPDGAARAPADRRQADRPAQRRGCAASSPSSRRTCRSSSRSLARSATRGNGDARAHKKEMLDILATMEAEFNEAEGRRARSSRARARRSRTRTRRVQRAAPGPSRRLIEELERHFGRRTTTTWRRRSSGRRTSSARTIKDQDERATIETQMRRLQRLQDSLAHWKTKLPSNQRSARRATSDEGGERRHLRPLPGAQGADEQVPRARGAAAAGADDQLARRDQDARRASAAAPSASSSSPSRRAATRPSARRCCPSTSRAWTRRRRRPTEAADMRKSLQSSATGRTAAGRGIDYLNRSSSGTTRCCSTDGHRTRAGRRVRRTAARALPSSTWTASPSTRTSGNNPVPLLVVIARRTLSCSSLPDDVARLLHDRGGLACGQIVAVRVFHADAVAARAPCRDRRHRASARAIGAVARVPRHGTLARPAGVRAAPVLTRRAAATDAPRLAPRDAGPPARARASTARRSERGPAAACVVDDRDGPGTPVTSRLPPVAWKPCKK